MNFKENDKIYFDYWAKNLCMPEVIEATIVKILSNTGRYRIKKQDGKPCVVRVERAFASQKEVYQDKLNKLVDEISRLNKIADEVAKKV